MLKMNCPHPSPLTEQRTHRMKREPERPSGFGGPELEHLERRLTEWLERIRQAREYVDARGKLWYSKPQRSAALFIAGRNGSIR